MARKNAGRMIFFMLQFLGKMAASVVQTMALFHHSLVLLAQLVSQRFWGSTTLFFNESTKISRVFEA